MVKGRREIEMSIVSGDLGFQMCQKGEGTSQLLRMVSRSSVTWTWGEGNTCPVLVSASCQALPRGQCSQLADLLSTLIQFCSAWLSLQLSSAHLTPLPDQLKPFIFLGGEEVVVGLGPSVATSQQSIASLSCIPPRDWTSPTHIPEHLLPMV